MPGGHNFPVNVGDINGQEQTAVNVAAVLGIVEYEEHPFAKGDLSLTGVQYSAEIGAATATTDVTVELATVNPLAPGAAIEYEFGLTAAFKATSSTTCTVGYYWRAKNATSSTWVNLHPGSTIAAPVGTAYAAEPTWSGRFKATTNLNKVPFEVALFMQCDEANEGYAKTKNSSYAKVVYSAD